VAKNKETLNHPNLTKALKGIPTKLEDIVN
jgi:hypothetical protein